MNKGFIFDSSQSKTTPSLQHAAHNAGPSINSPDNGSTPPPYHQEQLRLPVGGKVPEQPIISVPQLKVHLGLLRSFKELREQVTNTVTTWRLISVHVTNHHR